MPLTEIPKLFFVPKERPLHSPDWLDRANRLGDQWALARADMADASFWVNAGEAFRRRQYAKNWHSALQRAMSAEAQMDAMGIEYFDPFRWSPAELNAQPQKEPRNADC